MANASVPAAGTQTVGRIPQTTIATPEGGPFVRYAPTPSVQPAYTNPNLAFGARSQLPLSAVGGYLRGFYLTVQATGGTGTVAVYAADAPWNVIASLTIKDQQGQVIYQPLDGFGLLLMQLYSGQVANGGSQDPRVLPSYTAPATSGNFQFRLFLPFQVNSSGYCSLPCDNSAELPRLEILLNTSANVYTTPPTTLPSITLIVEEDYWPVPNNLPDLAPFDAGASAQWFVTVSGQNPPSGAAARILDQAVGQFLHTKVYVFRDGSNVRQDAFPVNDQQLWIDNYLYRYEPNFSRYDHMAQAFGVGTTVFQARSTGVIAHTWRQSVQTEVTTADDLERILVTTGATKLEIGGTWGTFTGTGQLYAYTGMVFPGPSGWPYGSQGF